MSDRRTMAGDSGMEGCKLHAAGSSHIVDDIIFQILLHLPGQSLMRFKCVCKTWRDLITSTYFCTLWQQHQHHRPGILLESLQSHRYVSLSGPTAGTPRFELPSRGHHLLQSCNGFLLYGTCDFNLLSRKYWVYNPATGEAFPLPPLRMDSCNIHPGNCSCFMGDGHPIIAFDSHSHGRVVTLSRHLSQRGEECTFIHQVCVSENQGPWTSSSEAFASDPLFAGVRWRNFVVWINLDRTLFYDVRGEEGLRFGDSPLFFKNQFSAEGHFLYQLKESGGHLHFIHIRGSRVIIDGMKHDLSGWFVKHEIELSQIRASIHWDVDGEDLNFFKIDFVLEEEEDPKLVLAWRRDVVVYRIRDHKWWKLCEWTGGDLSFPNQHLHCFAYPHVENIASLHGLLH